MSGAAHHDTAVQSQTGVVGATGFVGSASVAGLNHVGERHRTNHEQVNVAVYTGLIVSNGSKNQCQGNLLVQRRAERSY